MRPPERADFAKLKKQKQNVCFISGADIPEYYTSLAYDSFLKLLFAFLNATSIVPLQLPTTFEPRTNFAMKRQLFVFR